MKTGKIGFLLLIAFLITACALPAASPPPTPAPPTATSTPLPTATPTAPPLENSLKYDWDYWAVLIPGLYHLYGKLPDLDDLVDVDVKNTGNVPLRVKAEAQVETYTDWAIETVMLAPGEEKDISLHPVLQPESIERLSSLREANLHLRLSLVAPKQEVLSDFTDTITIQARRDFPWGLYKEIDGMSIHKNNLLLAAWVTPNDPAVEEWIRDAANYTPNGDMPSGYDYDVGDRLKALWEALDEDYEVTYVSTIVDMGNPDEEGLDFQRIRFPREVLSQQSANCIETTLLWASAAEALRLHPYIILVPGHAYVAIDSVPDGSKAYFIETTLIGSGDFEDAIQVGGDEWDKDGDKVENHANNYDYDMVDVWEAREEGILPMPWH